MKELIESELSGNSDMVFRWDARKVYMEKYGNIELPANLLKKWLIMRNEGLNEENVEESYQRMESDLKWQLVLDKIVEKLGVKIEKEDLLEFAKGLAARQFAQYGMTNMDEETITKYAENILADKNYIGRIQEQVSEVKTFNALKEAVSLAEETVSLDKFKEIASKL